MKEWIAKYQKAIVGTGAVAVLTLCYFQQKELSKLRTQIKTEQSTNVDSLIYVTDSLHDELFNANNAVGRYELTLEYLKEVNPKAGKQFEDYLSHETE